MSLCQLSSVVSVALHSSEQEGRYNAVKEGRADKRLKTYIIAPYQVVEGASLVCCGGITIYFREFECQSFVHECFKLLTLTLGLK